MGLIQAPTCQLSCFCRCTEMPLSASRIYRARRSGFCSDNLKAGASWIGCFRMCDAWLGSSPTHNNDARLFSQSRSHALTAEAMLCKFLPRNKMMLCHMQSKVACCRKDFGRAFSSVALFDCSSWLNLECKSCGRHEDCYI